MKFNGVDPCSLHRAISIEKEIPPGTAAARLETLNGNGGPVISDERMEPGEYLVRVNIFGGTQKTGWEVRELLAGWAFTKGLETAELIPTHAPDKCYDAKLKSISEPEFVHGGAKVEVRFLLPRPVMRETSLWASSGISIKTEIKGTYECRPMIRQTLNEAQNGLVWKKDNVPFLTLTGQFGDGDIVIMDTAKESLTINGKHAENRIDITGTKWRPGWWPGGTVITSDAYGTMRMEWHNEWL